MCASSLYSIVYLFQSYQTNGVHSGSSVCSIIVVSLKDPLESVS